MKKEMEKALQHLTVKAIIGEIHIMQLFLSNHVT